MFTVRAQTGRVMGRYATKAEAEARKAQLARQAEAIKGHRFGRGGRSARSPERDSKELEVFWIWPSQFSTASSPPAMSSTIARTRRSRETDTFTGTRPTLDTRASRIDTS